MDGSTGRSIRILPYMVFSDHCISTESIDTAVARVGSEHLCQRIRISVVLGQSCQVRGIKIEQRRDVPEPIRSWPALTGKPVVHGFSRHTGFISQPFLWPSQANLVEEQIAKLFVLAWRLCYA